MTVATRRALIVGAIMAVVAALAIGLRWRGGGADRDEDDSDEASVTGAGTPRAGGVGVAGTGSAGTGSASDSGTSRAASARASSTGAGSATTGSAPGATPSREGVSFSRPGSLAKIPDHYELSRNLGGTFVNMEGGASTDYGSVELGAARHAVHGRVVDRAGKPVVGAVVLVTSRIWSVGGSVSAPDGAVSDPQGEFTVENARVETPSYAIALHASGWSGVVAVGDAPLVLTMRGRGALTGRATYNGHGESFALHLEPRPTQPFIVDYETNPDGRYTIASLPPGTYQVTIGLAQPIAGGASKLEQHEVTIVDGQTATLDAAQRSATVVVVTAKLPPGYVTQMLEYWMFPGTAIPADLAATRARAKAEQAPWLLFGGQDAVTPPQFHDIAPGSYTICVAADRTALFGCTGVTVLDGDPAREVDVTPVPVAPVPHGDAGN